MMARRPRVTLHFAQSLDGRIALAGKRTPLSSAAGIELAHRARAEHDGVLVGSATVKVDDPQLAVMACEGRQPHRIVLASSLDVPSGARLFVGGPGTLVIGVEGRASAEACARLASAGARVRLVAPGEDGLVSLPSALTVILAWGIERLLVEGGARVLSSFLRHRLADEATVEIVPRLLGAPAVAAVGAIGVDALEHSVRLEDARTESAGASIVVRGRLAY
jgi:5-amino-6-(5-phosphoribosylamino)uracil reductase/diaminohydroxyphosphoribosylaminopyrimidine deaminase/5-amino-6-(5-phosphoribosylamino)uracil reductase